MGGVSALLLPARRAQRRSLIVLRCRCAYFTILQWQSPVTPMSQGFLLFATSAIAESFGGSPRDFRLSIPLRSVFRGSNLLLDCF